LLDGFRSSNPTGVPIYVNIGVSLLAFQSAMRSTMSAEEADRLQLKCKETRDALSAHLSQHHCNLGRKAV
jgi:hypothetical protein